MCFQSFRSFLLEIPTDEEMLTEALKVHMQVHQTTAVQACPDLPLQVSVNQGGVESEANVTEIHEDLHLDMMAGSRNSTGHFGIFSICWSPNGQEIAAATGDAKVVVFDMEEHKVRGASSLASL